MIKTHNETVGKEQLPIRPDDIVRGRRVPRGEVTKFGNFATGQGEIGFGKYTKTADNLTYQPYPTNGPNK